MTPELKKFPLPPGWRWVRLGEVCEIIKGKKPELFENKELNEMLPYLTAEVIRYGIKPKWAKTNDKNSVFVERDEIIIITDGSNSGDVFTGYKGILASTMGKLRINKLKIERNYIYFFIKMNFKNLNEPKRGSAIPHLEKEIFYNLEIPLPPLEEQKRIVARVQEIFQEVEKARAACEKQLAAAKTITSALLRQIFESEEAKGWKRVRLGDVCETKMGGTPNTENPSYWYPEEIIWVTPEVMERDVINFVSSSNRKISTLGLNKSAAKLFPTNTILLTTTATIGKVGIAKCPLSTNQQITGMICNDSLEPVFLAYYLLHIGQTGLKVLGGTSIATHINQSNLKMLKLPLPPLEEQKRIVAKVQEIFQEVEKARAALETQ
ncbi:MAG: restriction endonuclease subunit S, partial [candidate division WOR-3 bacterium]